MVKRALYPKGPGLQCPQIFRPPVYGFLANTTTPSQAVWACSSGCSLRGPLTCASSIHLSPPCWLAPSKRTTSSVMASNNREWSQTAEPWTSLCIAASNGSSFLATHRGNGYALRACHLMMMMMMMMMMMHTPPVVWHTVTRFCM